MNFKNILIVVSLIFFQTSFAQELTLTLIPPDKAVIKGNVNITATTSEDASSLTAITIFVDGHRHCWDVTNKLTCPWNTNKELNGLHVLSAVAELPEGGRLASYSTVYVFSDMQTASSIKQNIHLHFIK